jgi:predicted TIM-barrel fold metal-dependent hydrolase
MEMVIQKRRLTRREFVAGGAALVSLIGSGKKALAETAPHTVIDTHSHVFHRGLKLASGRRYAPDYDAPLSLYLAQLDQNGTTNGVLVQPSFLGTDNSYIVDCLGQTNGRLRGIAVVEPTISSQEILALDKAGIVGIRLNLVGQPLPDLTAPEWKTLLANLKAANWQVEIQRNASDLVGLVPKLLDADVAVVLDHYTLPDAKLGVDDPAFQSILTFGATKRVWVKISAPYRNGPNGEAFAKQAYPLLRNSFGLNHLLWGSDWPHTQFETTESYAKNRRFLDALITDPDERAKVLIAPRSLFRF